MIQTSYFANYRNFPEGKKTVSISRFTPDGVNADSCAMELAPLPELLKEYKEGKIDEAGYTKRYIDEVLAPLNPKEIAKRYKNSIFLCYEKEGDFCHRHVLANWLLASGENVEEVTKHIRIAIVGSRGFGDYEYFKQVIDKLLGNYKSFSFVSGGADGADSFAHKYSEERGAGITVHKPDWSKGKGAGFARNVKIWDDCDIGVAFWDGESKGTSHSFKIAEKQNKKLYVVEYLTKKIYISKGGK